MRSQDPEFINDETEINRAISIPGCVISREKNSRYLPNNGSIAVIDRSFPIPFLFHEVPWDSFFIRTFSAFCRAKSSKTCDHPGMGSGKVTVAKMACGSHDLMVAEVFRRRQAAGALRSSHEGGMAEDPVQLGTDLFPTRPADFWPRIQFGFSIVVFSNLLLVKPPAKPWLQDRVDAAGFGSHPAKAGHPDYIMEIGRTVGCVVIRPVPQAMLCREDGTGIGPGEGNAQER
jgi:hypothetical protein